MHVLYVAVVRCNCVGDAVVIVIWFHSDNRRRCDKAHLKWVCNVNVKCIRVQIHLPFNSVNYRTNLG